MEQAVNMNRRYTCAGYTTKVLCIYRKITVSVHSLPGLEIDREELF